MEDESTFLSREYNALRKKAREVALATLLTGENFYEDPEVARRFAAIHDFVIAFRDLFGEASEEAFEKIYPKEEEKRKKNLEALSRGIDILYALSLGLKRRLRREIIRVGVKSGRAEVDETKRAIFGLLNTIDLLYVYLVRSHKPVLSEGYELYKRILSGEEEGDVIELYEEVEISLAERPPKVIV